MTDPTSVGGPRDRRWLILGVIALAQLMVVLDLTVMNVALPPSALSLLTTTFTSQKDRGKAFGIYGAIAGAGRAVGLLRAAAPAAQRVAGGQPRSTCGIRSQLRLARSNQVTGG